MSDPEPFQLTVTRVASIETWEEYAQRCIDIVNYSRQRSAHLAQPEPPINFADETKWRKVSETSYELITPGYQQQTEETANERDTHFANFAEMLWHEVRKTSFDYPSFSEYQQLEMSLQLLFAQRAYDLMEHILLYAPSAPVPDLTEWPEQEK